MTSIPEGGASLESILCTEELERRPSRPPDYERENCALVALVSALADSPSTIFETLADTILDITQCDSAGLSLLTRDGTRPDADGKRFYWPAIAGMWNPHVGGGTPRNFGPCGDVLDQNRTLLFQHFERRYPYLLPVIPAAEECLLVPFYVAGKAVGTIWAIMHSDRRRFDAEDNRVMASLGEFASSAYQALVHIEDLKFQELRASLHATQLELAQVSRLTTMGELAASIAHEVNQPLTAVTNNANACLRLLSSGPENSQEVKAALSDITTGVDRVSQIIVRMRALAKKVPPEITRLHIEDVITDALTLIHHELTRRNVAVQSELAKDLPPVLGDRIQLQQVLLNLLMNGVEAMNAVAEGERKISIRARRDEYTRRPAVLVSVQDSGVGLKHAQVDRLFEAFYTTKAHGIGMGLAISRSIVEAHGGQLWVAPTAGLGARFEFVLPAPGGIPSSRS